MKTIMGALISVAILFGISGTALAGNDATGNAAPVCSEQTLRGTYVFDAQGFSIVNGAAKPKAILSGYDFHGDGTLSVKSVTLSLNGQILQFPPGGMGVYTVEESCEGTIKVTDGPSFNIFVRPNGLTVFMIETDAKEVLQGTLAKVPDAP